MKKIIAAILCGVLAVGTLTACEGKQALLEKQGTGIEYKEMANYEPLKAGDKIAVITVKDFGTIKIKLFPEYAPKGVENFIGLAEMGYYDELIFHRVIEGFVAQGGDPKGDGTGGNSIWGEDFDLETSEYLYHVTGAVAYAHAQNGGNSSQFYIVNTQPGMTFNGGQFEMTDEFLADYSIPDSVKETYKTDGGTPMLDGGYTVFGQVIEGMDVVYALSEVEVDPQTSKPVNQVLIEKIEIVDYQGE